MFPSDSYNFMKISNVKTQLATICKQSDIVFIFVSLIGSSGSTLNE